MELWKRQGGSFVEGPIEYDEVELPIAYERVLRTWAKWVEENVDPKHSSVFFSSMSPTHARCSNLTQSPCFGTRLLFISYVLCSFFLLFSSIMHLAPANCNFLLDCVYGCIRH